MKTKANFPIKSRYNVEIIGLFAGFIISIFDYLIIVDVSISIFYLLPIAFTSWHGKRKFSIFLALISCVEWFITESVLKTNLNLLLLLWNTTVIFIIFSIIAYLLSSLKIAYEQEKKLSKSDDLTGIANRRFFLELLRLESKRCDRYGHYLTLAYFDLDNFKEINDSLGHNTGDNLLIFVAQTIEKQIRETDTIARMGGDEFALLLPETNYEAGHNILLRLQQQLNTTIETYYPTVNFSMGAVTFLSFSNSTEKMLELVDSLMYEAKNNGKNRIEHRLYD